MNLLELNAEMKKTCESRNLRVGGTVPHLKALAALLEDLGLNYSTQMGIHNHLKLQFQGLPYLLASSGTGHTMCTGAGKTFMHKIIMHFWTLFPKNIRTVLAGFKLCFILAVGWFL